MLRNARSSLNAVKHRTSAFHTTSLIRFVSTALSAERTPPSAPSVPLSTPDSNASTSRHGSARRRLESKPDLTSPKEELEPKRLLKPHILSTRLTRMCSDGKVDEAFEYLKTLPLDAQNTAVWNTLIGHAGSEKRYRLAYQIYVEMKRRGFRPNVNTYATLMGAFNKVDSWANRTKLYESVHKAYESYLGFIAAVKEHNPDSPQISVSPATAYIQILSKAGDYQRAFDVWNSLDEEGPFSPNRITYTVMFKTCFMRGLSAKGEDAQEIRERAASDARLIWRHYTKRIERGGDIAADVVLIDSVFQALGLGRPADHIVAFDILRDYAGLAKPGETAPPPRVQLSAPLLHDVLWLCNTAQKPRLCVHFVQQVMEKQPDILDRGHMDHMLTAYGTLSSMGTMSEASRALQTVEWMIERELTTKDGLKIRPGLSTFTLVLIACWRAKDWDSALRTFELMTGYNSADFADGATGTPKMARRSPGRNVMPDAAAMSCLVRTALETGNPATMRQCLRIVKHLGLSQLLGLAPSSENEVARRESARFWKDRLFYAHKTAQGVVELVEALVPKKTDESPPLTTDQRVWMDLRSEARTFLVSQRDKRPRTTPELEEQPLGSAEGLAAMDSAVEWSMVHREQKSAR